MPGGGRFAAPCLTVDGNVAAQDGRQPILWLYGYLVAMLRDIMSLDIPIGTRVRIFREGRGLSQLQGSPRTGLTQPYIRLLGRGPRTPSNPALPPPPPSPRWPPCPLHGPT